MNQQELRDLEARCIQDCPPPCVTTCPLHIDVRGMMARAAEGDFAGGYDMLSRRSPFPGIIGAVCEQPCQMACNRAGLGGAIEIAAIEAACALHSGKTAAVGPIRPKGKRVAIIGGGLSGLTAAVDLARKGWEVTIYEATEQLGGALLSTGIPQMVLENDLAILDRLAVKVVTNAPETDLASLRTEFAAIYIGTGAGTLGDLAADPVTLATNYEGVFIGGSMLHPDEVHSFIRSAAEGRRSAVSIDRFLQGVGLLSSRVIEEEGPYESCLYTDIEGIEPVRAALARDSLALDQEAATVESKRCLLCECMECVKVCEFLNHYGEYPRKHFRTLYNNLSIVKGTRLANQFMNSCAMCGLCGEVCPTDLDTGDAFHDARELAVEQGKMPPSAHDFALRDMTFSQGDAFAMARHQPEMAESAYLFFPGCQLAGTNPDTILPVYNHLTKTVSGGVGLMLDCCGAPAYWAGCRAHFEGSCALLRDKIHKMGDPTLILACSSCMAIFREHLPDVRVTSLWEVFDEQGMPEPAQVSSTRSVTVHDPCTARYETTVQESIRSLLSKMGIAITELEMSRQKTECCSFGGLMYFANRELADDVIQRRIAESPETFLTYCAMCRDLYAGGGKPTLHMLDLIVGSGEPYGRVGYFHRQENRARLKRQLKAELWRERSDETMPGYHDIPLLIDSDTVLRRIEDRLILKEEIQQVIYHAEQTGECFLQADAGRSLAHLRIGEVTYWVEYERKDDTYVVTNAYSHRIVVIEGEGA